MRLPPPITSRTNARVKALRASLSGDARRPGDVLGLEGEHLLQEAHDAGLSFEAVFVREGDEALLERSPFYATLRTQHWFVLSREVFAGAVSTSSPQGIVATWRITALAPPADRQPVYLLLEDLQDPGNVGTLIRSVRAFAGCAVYITPSTVNEWNPKTLRSAAGAAFHVPVRRMPLAQAVAELRAQGATIFAAVGKFRTDAKEGQPALADHNGVLTGTRSRQTPFMAQTGPGSRSYPASLAYDTDFLLPCAIMIGNEGAGLSQAARLLADEQVQIPCQIESLNAAVAGSILLYEVMRQQPLRAWARAQGLRS